MKRIDLNCDMAELIPGQNKNFDDKIMPFISSCNVACGFHSGNPAIIEKTIRSAIRHQAKIGAHPSYNDPTHFGRKSVDIRMEELVPELRYQICAVKSMVESLGAKLNHVKAHGALYNDMANNEELAISFVHLVKEIDPHLKIYGLAESMLKNVSKHYNMKFVSEGFADRRYQSRTQLRKRSLEDAVIVEKDQILAQIALFSQGKLKLHSGKIENISIDTLCLHSDTPGAIKLAEMIHNYFKTQKIVIG